MSDPKSPEQQLIDAMASFEHDPYGYVLFSFEWGMGELKGKKVRKWQREVLQEISEKLKAGEINSFEAIQIAIASGHGIGKSALVAWVILWAMATKVDTKGVVTANTDTQLRTKTWPELTKWHNLSINKHWFECTATAIYSKDSKHARTWRIDQIPWSIHNTEAFAGLHNQGKRILVVFDEASAVHDKIFEVTEGALTDEDTEIIWLCFGNPTRNTGRFRECFRKYKHRWIHKNVDSRGVDGTNKKQIQKWLEDYGEDSDFFKIRVRGIFPSASAKQFISTALVDAAFDKKIEPHQYDFAPSIVTCDPSWTGDDDLIIAHRQGLFFQILETIPKNDDDVFIASKLAEHADNLAADAVFVDLGYGTGIVSAGRAMGYRDWILVNFGAASNHEGCHLKRSEMWNSAKEWLKEGGCLPDDQELYDELIAPELKPRLDGKILLESKEDMKTRGIPSPNKADSLVLSFAYPVRKKKNKSEPKKSVARRSVGWMGG